MNSKTIRVIVADDHSLYRDGVVKALGLDTSISVVGEAADAQATLDLVRRERPDVLLLDMRMPGGGLHAAARVVATCPATRIVVLTMSAHAEDVLAALEAGASGYVLKDIDADDLINVVKAVVAGQRYVAPTLAFGLLRHKCAAAANPLDALSSRERQVTDLLASGLSNHQIGLRLGLSETTIKSHMKAILNKLQVNSRVEAALLAARVASN
jgi:two-component system, NarL family, nitrate/nitrite response regulator NarL